MHPDAYKKDEKRQAPKARRLTHRFILHPSTFILFFFLFLSAPLAGQININTATEQELTSLPYIGTARAQAIVKHRNHHGRFRHPEDLLDVEFIGPKSLEAIRPHITLSSQLDSGSAAQTFALANGQIMLLADDQYFPILMNFVKTAGQHIDVAMFLFKTTNSKNNRPAQLVEELIKARKRGVMVQVVLEKSGYSDSINVDNQRVAAMLQKNNITVRFDSLKKTTHTKIVIIDNRFCFVGSHNFTNSALGFNHEISLLLDNRDMAEQLLAYIAAIK